MTDINWGKIQEIIEAQINDALISPDPSVEWPSTQILEVIPLDDGTGFKVVYSGTPASPDEPNGLIDFTDGPNYVTGLDFQLAIDEIEGINENYIPDIDTAETPFFNDELYSYQESGEDGFNHLIKGAIVDFLGNFPAAAALPVEILSFSTPSQNGPIFLEITDNGARLYSIIGIFRLCQFTQSN